MPDADVGRAIQQAVQRLLADLRAGILQERGDRVDVVAVADRVGDLGAHLGAPRDRHQGARDRRVLDDLQQVLVGEHRGKAQHRPRDHDLAVAGKATDHVGRDIGDVLQDFRDHLAHPRHLVAHQDLQHLVGDLAHALMLLGAEIRRQAGDLRREIDPHAVVAVARQDQIRLHRRRLVGGHRRAHARVAVGGEVIERLGPCLAVMRELDAIRRVGARGQLLRFLVVDRALGTAHPAHDALDETHHAESALPFTGCAAAKRSWPLPASLAWYIAWSARTSSAAGVSPRAGS